MKSFVSHPRYLYRFCTLTTLVLRLDWSLVYGGRYLRFPFVNGQISLPCLWESTSGDSHSPHDECSRLAIDCGALYTWQGACMDSHKRTNDLLLHVEMMILLEACGRPALVLKESRV